MAKKAQLLRIGSFNLFNLVAPGVKYYNNKRYSKNAFNRKVVWQSNQLEKMKADIVGFQELFYPEGLQTILKKTKQLENAQLICAKPIIGSETERDRPAVALASRFPIIYHETIEDFPELLNIDEVEIPLTKFSRPVLRAIVKLQNDTHLQVFVAHLKSKRPMISENADPFDPIEQAKGEIRSLVKRAVEANALRYILVDTLRNNNMPMVVLGDLNDGSLAVSTRTISGSPPWRYLDFEIKKRAWDTLLYHAKDIQARQSLHDVYYTHIHNGHYESLDHIMVSQELYAHNPRHIGIIRNVSLFNDHLIDDTLSSDRIPNWQSDHGQVVATIEFKEALVERL